MHNNWFYLLILSALTVVVVIFGLDAGKKLIAYTSMREVGEAKEIKYSLLQESEESYKLQASYTFTEEGKEYCGYQLFDTPRFLNKWAGEQAIAKMEGEKQRLYFSPKNPRDNALKRSFPMKSILYSVLLLGLWCYFLWLGFYVTQFSQKK